MRLSRLDLTRFGKFTDCTIGFPAGGADFHLIHGPNEAGKSTLRQALLDLFYGIHARTPYDFKHGYAKMEIGGAIDDPVHGPLTLTRFKRTKNPLLDADGRPLNEAELARWLAHTDREAFERMFAIDHAKLVAGGQSILATDGDFGRMLFEAAAGVGNLADTRKQIESEADDLWGLRKRKDHQFTQAEERLVAAKTKLNEVSLSAAQWKAADQALKDAQATERAADDELAEHATRQRQLERIKRVATPLERFRLATEARTTMGTPVAFPEGAAATFDAAEQALTKVAAQRGPLATGLEANQTALAGLTLHPALTQHKDDITALLARRGVFQKAQSDLPGVRRERDGALAGIAGAARGLGWVETDLPAIAAKLPTPLVRADLAAHLKLRPDLVHAVESARQALANQQDAIAALDAQLAAAPNAAELPALTRALAEAQALNYTDAASAAAAAVEAAKAKATALFAAVQPYRGTVSDLAGGDRPSTAEVATLTDERARLEASRQSATEQLERENAAVAQAEVAVTAHTQDRVPVSAEALQAQRQARDGLWAGIRSGAQTLAAAGAAYEQAVRAADALADDRYSDAAYVAKARELQNVVLTRGVERDHTQLRLERVTRDLALLNQRWSERVTVACGVFIPLEQYPAWFAAREAFLVALAAAEAAEHVLGGLMRRGEAVATKLRAALAEAGVAADPDDFALLVLHATQVQNERTAARLQQQGWRTSWEQQQHALPGLARALQEAEAAVTAWHARRDALMQAAGVPVAAGTEGAERALLILTEIEQSLRTATSLVDRVAAMEAEIDGFTTETAALVQACAPDLAGRPPAETVVLVDARLREEERVVAEHDRLTKAVSAAEKQLATIAATEADAMATLGPLFAAAKVATVDELRAAVRRWGDCHAADRQLQELREAVVNNGDGIAFDTLVAEVAAENMAALGSELDAVARRVTEIEAKRKAAVEVRTKAQEALAQYVGQDTAVRAEADRQDALLLMREAADGHLKLALGAKLLAWATNRYAERKQEPLLKAASAIFAKLTLGSFERLAVGYDDTGAMTLYAYRPDGTHLPIGKGLSTGTEAQLYLALRLASLQQHVAAGNALPFLGDDIFMGWDPGRCAAGIEVLLDLAKTTQVILLTHDANIAESAKQVVQRVTASPANVIELP